jgi:helix-turn-helix protein
MPRPARRKHRASTVPAQGENGASTGLTGLLPARATSTAQDGHEPTSGDLPGAGPRSLLTLAQAAAQLQIDAKTLRREARDGKLALVPIRGALRVRQAELDRYVREQEERWTRSTAATNALVDKPRADAAAALHEALNRYPPPATDKTTSRLFARRPKKAV